jgi:hypothetical protein
MELVVKVFMERNLQMKHLLVNIWEEGIYQWQIQEPIRTGANFSLILKKLLGWMVIPFFL